ncbi:hypothetical protein KO481_33995 [Nocardia sp. NEAU-G5]|uniref:Uncharacterized protein n=1 Tax=Nocardia albiluteola TaxID=2842303 RepID=A0ABS6BAT7_9NOCA|nr:hypothetical protein [Nocardia albiluteola]MBU3066520.1 hypothetical protein [Nocardia albiluteola]
MVENTLRIRFGDHQKTSAGTPFREPCFAQVLGHVGTGLEGIEICFTLRGSAAATFPSPPSGDGITWFAATSSEGISAAIPITPHFAGTVEGHVTAKMIPAPHPVDFTLTAG